jgi:hypothetical protein
MESCVLRARKATEKEAGPTGAMAGTMTEAMADAARVFVHDAMDRVEKNARTALAATEEGDTLRTQLAVLKRFTKHEPVNSIALRRRVAAAALANSRYPFEVR